jgi:hypothetical protein
LFRSGLPVHGERVLGGTLALYLLRYLYEFVPRPALVQALGNFDAQLVEHAGVVEDGEGVGVVGKGVWRALVLHGLPERWREVTCFISIEILGEINQRPLRAVAPDGLVLHARKIWSLPGGEPGVQLRILLIPRNYLKLDGCVGVLFLETLDEPAKAFLLAAGASPRLERQLSGTRACTTACTASAPP